MRYEVVEEFANNDLLIDIPVSPQARKKNPSFPKHGVLVLLLIAYNLVRLEMAAIAKEAKVAPTRISFTAAISLIDTPLRWLALSSDGKLPAKLKQMRADIKHFILPDKRKHRTYPRSVLYIPSRYPLNYKQ